MGLDAIDHGLIPATSNIASIRIVNPSVSPQWDDTCINCGMIVSVADVVAVKS
jgi:hypothetical protein